MNVIETQDWTMLLPPEWLAEEEDDVVLVSDVDGVGVLEISCLKREEGLMTEADVKGFAEELVASGVSGRPVKVGVLKGFLFEYEEDGEWCRDWFVAVEDLFILVSYTCMGEDKGMDDATVDELVATIIPLDELED
ncbi:MAG: hypothetical protein V7711_16295 [Pseudomonadales bacterium]